ncbi:MAG: hypothetical protein K2X47_20105, partial [Bdellovibrionales bacterium]|nr:hypothetical protein [Bdellovibrionales bacterium]
MAKNPSADEVIKTANEKFLEENRVQAITILTQAMKTEKKDSAGYRKLSKALSQVNETFISEKAQQLFELSRSIRATEPQIALEKLKSANELEADNLMILRGMVSLMLAAGDCDKARELATQTLLKNPYSDLMMMFKIQSSICLKKMDLLRSDLSEGLVRPVEGLKQVLSAQIEVGQAVVQKQEGKLDIALKHLEKAQSLDPRFAEIRWMTHLIYLDTKKVDLSPLREYVDICGKEKATKIKDADF